MALISHGVLSLFCRIQINLEEKTDRIHLKIALAQFDLLAKMCAGNNRKAIEYLTKKEDNIVAVKLSVTFIIDAFERYSGLRAKFVELLKGTIMSTC